MTNRAHRSLSVAASFAALCLVGAGAQAAECFDRDAAEIKAGNATAVTGPEVGLQRSDADGFMRPRAGADLFTGDRVRTGEASHLQLKLCDWSTYTFSPQSESEISEFYSEDGARRRRVVNFFRGGFRLASGRSTEPGSTEVRIQESGVTMGVRGTSVLLAEVDGVVYAVLEGPVKDNTGYQPRGEVGFWTGDNRNAIISRLRQPGWAVTVGPEGVSEPFKAPDIILQRIYQAFVPAPPPGEEVAATSPSGAGDPEGDSGQAAQQGATGSQQASNAGQTSNKGAKDLPTQPSEAGVSTESNFNEAFPSDLFPPIEDLANVLSGEELETFGGTAPGGRGFFSALVPAALVESGPQGDVVLDEGVAFIQMHIDFDARSLWPEVGVSFIKLDFSVSDVNDLTIEDRDFQTTFLRSIGAAVNTPFDTALGDLGVFRPEDTGIQFIVRKGVDANGAETITLDTTVIFDENDPLQPTDPGQRAEAFFNGLEFQPGQAELVRFSGTFADIATRTELENLPRSDVALFTGSGSLNVFPIGADDQFGFVNSLFFAPGFVQFQIDFANRLIGGGQSFVFLNIAQGAPLSSPASSIFPGAQVFIPFDTPAPFDSGLFNLGLFPLSSLTNDPDVFAGQLILRGSDSGLTIAEFGAALNTDSGLDLLVLDFLFENPFGPITTSAELLSLQGTGFYAGFGGFAQLVLGDFAATLTGNARVEIDIDFDNRTIGGGESFVEIVLDSDPQNIVTLTDFMQSVPFSRAEGDLALFGLDSGDFANGVIDNLNLIIRNDQGLATVAETDFTFSDAAGNPGVADVFLQFQTGSSAGPP